MSYALSAIFRTAITPSNMAIKHAQWTARNADVNDPARQRTKYCPVLWTTNDMNAMKAKTPNAIASTAVHMPSNIRSWLYGSAGDGSAAASSGSNAVAIKCATKTSRHFEQVTGLPSRVGGANFFAPHFGHRNNMRSSMPPVLRQSRNLVNGGA